MLAGIDFSDVVPVDTHAYEGPAPIAHAPDFVRVHGLLYALVRRGETSRRALDVCAAAIELNAANYTAWQHRRDCLAARIAEAAAETAAVVAPSATAARVFADELAYTAGLLTETSKNYQLWHHRRWVVESSRDASRELDFTETILAEDAKHYHAWSHRLWAVREFGLWAGEAAFAARFIADDVRNNSAWNHRYCAVTRGGDRRARLAPGVSREGELAFARDALLRAPSNESARRYRDAMLHAVEEGGSCA